MRKTGSLVGWLVCGVFACACGSSSTSHKDAGPFGRDSGAEDVLGGEVAALGDAGGGPTTGVEVGAQAVVLTIGNGMAFTTPNLVVLAGTVITVQNQDSVPHTVTSEAAPNAFSPSGAFDTGVLPAGGSATITIPAGAASGTIFYYYCGIHTAMMSPPNGTITIQ